MRESTGQRNSRQMRKVPADGFHVNNTSINVVLQPWRYPSVPTHRQNHLTPQDPACVRAVHRANMCVMFNTAHRGTSIPQIDCCCVMCCTSVNHCGVSLQNLHTADNRRLLPLIDIHTRLSISHFLTALCSTILFWKVLFLHEPNDMLQTCRCSDILWGVWKTFFHNNNPFAGLRYMSVGSSAVLKYFMFERW